MSYSSNTTLSTACLHIFSRVFKVINILIAFAVLFNCSFSANQAPVTTRGQPPNQQISKHIVAPGETLYAIAWRYGLDYKKLAKANKIGDNFSIFPGQIIHLTDKVEKIHKYTKTRSVTSVTPPKLPTLSSKKNHSAQKKNKPTVSSKPVQSSSRLKSRSEKKSISQPSKNQNNGEINWRWPSRGKVLTNFESHQGLKKGIDIGGKKGDAVMAAASGQVVYAGSGLRGYGKLVIVKHNEIYLSAYAYNHRLRVREGDNVKAGQHIADIGSTGIGVNKTPRLHFQIRRNGKPINPLPLLPRRR